MSRRNLILLVLALVVLLGANLLQKTRHRQAVTSSDTRAVIEADYRSDDINRIVLAWGADTTSVVLERLPDHWVTRSAFGHPAADRKIADLLGTFAGLQGEFRSDNPALLTDYGLGPDDQILRLTLFGKEWEPVFDLELGAQAPDGQGVFAREPGSDTVFLVRENVLGRLGMYSGPGRPESRFFLDLAVHACDRKDIEAITLHVDDTSLAMEKVFAPAPGDTTGVPDRSNWEWVLTAPERRPLAKTKVDAILSALTNVTAADVADPREQLEGYGLWKAARRVEVGLADGTTWELRVGDAAPAGEGGAVDHWCMTSEDRTIWLIREFKINQIFKSLDELLPTD